MKILHNIPINIEVEEVFSYLRLGNSNYLSKIFTSTEELLEQTISIAKPKALYEVSYIDNIDGNAIYIDGIKFISHVLRANLEHIERVFPYIVTCGNEVEKIVRKAIKNAAPGGGFIITTTGGVWSPDQPDRNVSNFMQMIKCGRIYGKFPLK